MNALLMWLLLAGDLLVGLGALAVARREARR